MSDARGPTGFAFPLVPSGGFRSVTGADALTQSIRSLLFTEPGERLGRPTYGCGLRRFLFAPNTVTTRTQIQDTIRRALVRDEPRVAVEAVDVRSGEGGSNRLNILIRYRLRGDPTPRSLETPFTLDSERGAS